MRTVEQLIAEGYKMEHHEADWEDVGDAENGPHVVGHPEHDYYHKEVGNNCHYAIVIDGEIKEEGIVPNFPDDDIPF